MVVVVIVVIVMAVGPFTSGLSTLKKDQIAERGARVARRDDREYREYLREEQRRQAGCPAREVVLLQRGQATGNTRGAAAGGKAPLRLFELSHDPPGKHEDHDDTKTTKQLFPATRRMRASND